MSSDRKNDDKTRIARIQLTSRPPIVRGRAEEEGGEGEISIVEQKRRESAAAIARLKAREAEKAANTPDPQDAELERIQEVQKRAAENAVVDRQRDSMRAIQRVKDSQAPASRTSVAPRSVPPVRVRPSVAPVAPQRESVRPLSKIYETAVQGMEAALKDPKAIRTEAFRFFNYLVKILEGRERLEARFREIINRPEYASEVITIAIQIDQLTAALKRIEDFLLNSLELDDNGVAKPSLRNVSALRSELAKAEEGISQAPSSPPKRIEEAEIDADYMKPDDRLIREFAGVKAASREESAVNDFGSFFEALEGHWQRLIQTTGLRVSLDTAYSREFMSSLGKKLAQTSLTTAPGAGLRRRPARQDDSWNGSLRNLTGMVARGLNKAETLYRPASNELLRQIDPKVLKDEFRRLGGELQAVEEQLQRQLDEPEGGTSFLGTIRGKIGEVMNRPVPTFKARSELEAKKSELKQRMIGVKRLERQKIDLDNREDR